MLLSFVLLSYRLLHHPELVLCSVVVLQEKPVYVLESQVIRLLAGSEETAEEITREMKLRECLPEVT